VIITSVVGVFEHWVQPGTANDWMHVCGSSTHQPRHSQSQHPLGQHPPEVSAPAQPSHHRLSADTPSSSHTASPAPAPTCSRALQHTSFVCCCCGQDDPARLVAGAAVFQVKGSVGEHTALDPGVQHTARWVGGRLGWQHMCVAPTWASGVRTHMHCEKQQQQQQLGQLAACVKVHRPDGQARAGRQKRSAPTWLRGRAGRSPARCCPRGPPGHTVS
jgi:hypothetical protein